jgi:hypothetical protein
MAVNQESSRWSSGKKYHVSVPLACSLLAVHLPQAKITVLYLLTAARSDLFFKFTIIIILFKE